MDKNNIWKTYKYKFYYSRCLGFSSCGSPSVLNKKVVESNQGRFNTASEWAQMGFKQGCYVVPYIIN